MSSRDALASFALPSGSAGSGREFTATASQITAQPAEQSSSHLRSWKWYPGLLMVYDIWKRGDFTRLETVSGGSFYITGLDELSADDKESLFYEFSEACKITRDDRSDTLGSSSSLAALQASLTAAAGLGGTGLDPDFESDRHDARKRQRGDEGEEEESRGRVRRVREEEFPWYKADQNDGDNSRLTTSMRETRRIIDAARPDVPTVVYWIQRVEGSPSNFPVAEWTNIFHGRAVDLGNVRSNMHVFQVVQENTGSIGGVPFRVAEIERSKSIRTSGDWSSAWRKTVEATALGFPHRREELDQYGGYIESLFSSTAVPGHGRIILYDEAIRRMVGGGTSCSLLDHQRYQHLFTAIMLPGGVEYNRVSRPRVDSGRPSETCNRFNSAAGCRNGPNCRYQHICTRCGDPGHNRTSCLKGKSPSSS